MEQNTLEITERSEVFEFTSLRAMVNQALQKRVRRKSNFQRIIIRLQRHR
jgi:hypothetical protein